VAAGACQILPKLTAVTPILTIMIYEIVSSCGRSAYLERQSGIGRSGLGTHPIKASSLVEISTSYLKRLVAGHHVEPLRAHKYPIPREAHCGVQIKVGFSKIQPDMLPTPAARCTTISGTTSQRPPMF
jgi:hypothetical protein